MLHTEMIFKRVDTSWGKTLNLWLFVHKTRPKPKIQKSKNPTAINNPKLQKQIQIHVHQNDKGFCWLIHGFFLNWLYSAWLSILIILPVTT